MSSSFWPSGGGKQLTNDAVLETVSSYTSQPELIDLKDRGGSGSTPPALSVTPSADPDLWAAIMASLEEQSQQQRRKLNRHLSDAAPEVAGRLRQHRADALRMSPQGIAHFEGPLEAASSGLVLPSFAGYPGSVREAVLHQLCNDYLRQEAEQEGVINCIPGCTPQLVLATLGDGNCLSHACSLGVWGIHDRDSRLRNAIAATMGHPAAGAEIRSRFERQLALNGIPKEDWVVEWDRELKSLTDSSTYLSDVHCYTLANVLRRPLLIYGDAQAAAAALSGIYLPSLWPSPHSQCSRQPLAVLYGWSHFSLLCTVQGEGPASPPLLPLCTRDGPLQLRFLSQAEEAQLQQQQSPQQPLLPLHEQHPQQQPREMCTTTTTSSASDRQLHLLCRYMDAQPLFNGCLGVRLSESPRPHVLVELLGSIYVRQAAEQHQQQQQQQQQAAAPAAAAVGAAAS